MLLLHQSWKACRLFKSDIRDEDFPQELAITEQASTIPNLCDISCSLTTWTVMDGRPFGW